MDSEKSSCWLLKHLAQGAVVCVQTVPTSCSPLCSGRHQGSAALPAGPGMLGKQSWDKGAREPGCWGREGLGKGRGGFQAEGGWLLSVLAKIMLGISECKEGNADGAQWQWLQSFSHAVLLSRFAD